MEIKKYKKYDLERRRPMFFGMGMIISLSFVLVAFEWKAEIDPIVIPQEEEIEEWTVLIDPVVTRHPDIKPPKPIKQEKKVVSQANIIKEIKEEIFELQPQKLIDQGGEIVDIVEPSFGIKEEDPEEVFIFVEENPSFPGGFEALYQHIARNLQYPKKAQRIGVEGKVTLQFIVDTDGSLSEIKVLRGIGAGCDEEAIRVLETLPKFSPGKQRGKPVRVQMQIPITFRLR